MKRILIGVLLVVLATSYMVQKEHVLKELSAPLTEQMRPVLTETMAMPKVRKSQEVELMAYPAPGDEPLPPYPAPNIPTRTPLPTPTLVYPTPGPTMNPWGD